MTPLPQHPSEPPKDEDGKVSVRPGWYPKVLAQIDHELGSENHLLYWHVDFQSIAQDIYLLYAIIRVEEVPGFLFRSDRH